MARSELPTGTVTFLFTDVEGSTRLLDELGAGPFGEALAAHRDIVRETIAEHGGVEVDTQGDAFFVAFPTAPGALAAADAIRSRLEPGPIRLRMGVHTGTPVLSDEGYVGGDVHRAARIAAAGHGGQVLVSASAAALVPRAGAALVDLGEHRFKDLRSAERVFQLGDGEFPPIRGLSRGNLPVPATEFLGRERELEEVVALLGADGVRLVTLIGPGGTGKTRLALQAAAEGSERFPSGIWWVALAPLRDPALVLPATAQSLGLGEQSDVSWLERIAGAVDGGRALMLLDNAEHLLPEAAGTMAELAAVGKLVVLVTSRARLHVRAEHVVSVPSMEQVDAVGLFVARAMQVDSSFRDSPAVGDLCRRLDDLPLAIELAAARTSVFSVPELVERLGQRLDLLRGPRDADPRQRTLRATIEWSHGLVDDAGQRLFAGLSVFVGGCTYSAAEAVCGADPDTLETLIDESLVRRRDAPDGSRYWMLETIREFAVELLEADERAVGLRAAHAAYYAAFAEQAGPQLQHGPDQLGWADRVALEYDNIRAAIRFGLAEDPELALRMIAGIAFFVWLRGGFAEARGWVDEALEAGREASPMWRGRLLVSGALIAERQGDLAGQTRFATDGYATASAAGDGFGMTAALRERGKAAISAGDLERARRLYTELAALADEVGDDWNGAIALNNLGDLALYDGDWARTIDLCGRSSEIRFALGDRWGGALALSNVATAQIQSGDFDAAARSLGRALEESLAVNGRMVVQACLGIASLLASVRGDQRRVAVLQGATARLLDELDTAVDNLEGELMQRAEAEARAALGDEEFRLAFEHGRTLEPPDAAALAVAPPDGRI